jgi:hypothetical protein
MNLTNNFNHPVIVLLTLILASGCTTTTSKMNIIQPGDPISIVLSHNLTKENLFNMSNGGIAEDAGTGATAGATTGAAAGLLCGPFFVFCSPLFAVVGGVGGATAGAVVGANTGLEQDEIATLTTKMNSFLNDNDPQDGFLNQVLASASRHYNVKSSSAENELSVVIEKLLFSSTSDGRLVLKLQANASVTYVNQSEEHKSINRDYEYEGAPEFVEAWIEGEDDFYLLKLSDAYRTVADHIIRTL